MSILSLDFEINKYNYKAIKKFIDNKIYLNERWDIHISYNLRITRFGTENVVFHYIVSDEYVDLKVSLKWEEHKEYLITKIENLLDEYNKNK